MEKQHTIYLLLAGAVTACCLLGATAVNANTGSQKDAPALLSAAVGDVSSASFPEAPMPALTFTDVPEDSKEALRYLVYLDCIQGVSQDTFDPTGQADRETVLQALYQLSGEDTGLFEYGDLTQSVTRAQLAELLHQFAVRQGWAAEDAVPLDWVIRQGIYRTFVGAARLPDMPVSRLQLAHALTGLLSASGDQTAKELFLQLPVRTTEHTITSNDATLPSQIAAIAKQYGAVGLQVAVVKQGQVTATYSYGWAAKNSIPMTDDHKLRCASISKVLVGVSAMLLRESGVISLDTDISEYWDVDVGNPAYKDNPITIGKMLNHTSSIINAGDATSRKYADVKVKLQGSGYSGAVPGDAASWCYNNYAFAALGMTLELASGQYLDDLLDQRLFQAMDIDAAYFPGELENTDLLANVYRADGTIGRSTETQYILIRGDFPGSIGTYFAGGLTISAKDLGKIAALLANDGVYEGVRLMDAESVALMETGFSLEDGSSQGMPFRSRSNLYGRDVIYYHTGSAYGAFNCFSYDPATGDGVVVLTTGTGGARDENSIYTVCSKINSLVYETLKS